MTEDQIKRAREMRRPPNPMTYKAIAAVFGVHLSTARRHVLEGEPQRRREREREARREREKRVICSAAIERDARVLLAQIPEDTRDLTAVAFGDPLPGRSALDMRGGV
jgi:hypothetical protein